jgi:hypothetical protein
LGSSSVDSIRPGHSTPFFDPHEHDDLTKNVSQLRSELILLRKRLPSLESSRNGAPIFGTDRLSDFLIRNFENAKHDVTYFQSLWSNQSLARLAKSVESDRTALVDLRQRSVEMSWEQGNLQKQLAEYRKPDLYQRLRDQEQRILHFKSAVSDAAALHRELRAKYAIHESDGADVPADLPMLEQMLQLKRERWASARSHYEKLLERHNAELRIATDGISTFWAVPVREPKTPAPERRRALHIPNTPTNRSRPSDPDPLEEEHKNSTEVLVGLFARRVRLWTCLKVQLFNMFMTVQRPISYS